jgi:hypothetical protein
MRYHPFDRGQLQLESSKKFWWAIFAQYGDYRNQQCTLDFKKLEEKYFQCFCHKEMANV